MAFPYGRLDWPVYYRLFWVVNSWSVALSVAWEREPLPPSSPKATVCSRKGLTVQLFDVGRRDRSLVSPTSSGAAGRLTRLSPSLSPARPSPRRPGFLSHPFLLGNSWPRKLGGGGGGLWCIFLTFNWLCFSHSPATTEVGLDRNSCHGMCYII